METSGEPVPQDEYPSSAVLGATLATLFFPLISLIVALVLMGQQRSERKRAQLKTWAWASAGWIALQFVVGLRRVRCGLVLRAVGGPQWALRGRSGHPGWRHVQ